VQIGKFGEPILGYFEILKNYFFFFVA